MTWIDGVFLFLVLGVSPVYSLWGYRKLHRDLEAGRAVAKVREYVESIALLWLTGIGALVIWALPGRPLEAIGIAMPRGFAVVPASAIALGVVWFLSAQLARVRRTDRRLEGMEQIESVRAMLPESSRELRWFTVTALSAGVFEEIVYRGYLIAILDLFMPLWAAAVLSSVAFAWGHIYQGWARLPQIFVLSLGLAGLYVWTGSLLLPMLLHAFVDINSALTARAALERTRDSLA